MYFEENYKMKCFQLLCDIYCPISSFGLINSFGCANLSIFHSSFFNLSSPIQFSLPREGWGGAFSPLFGGGAFSPLFGRGVGGEAVEGWGLLCLLNYKTQKRRRK